MSATLLMVGLPSSGKTTFLAALYELVQDESRPDGALALREQPADREYLYEINQTWLKVEELDHSNLSTPRHILLPLADPAGSPLDLEIPDVAGERFEQGWTGEDWPAQLAEIATRADGVLLFVHGTELEPPVKLSPGDLTESEEGANTSGDDGWDATKAPTQTILADLLEALSELNDRTLPVAVIVSAWDRAQGEVTPAAWLELNLPLVWQMLTWPGRAAAFDVFGVSAQGGDVTDPAEHDRLGRVSPVYERVAVVHDGERFTDISAPVRWLVEQLR